uniref:Bifunctional inhibitor/plant lipid transfer protein/seed storage helical domain-containing protein n=2 Tax=Chloropicon primus TaxID=1764295 RepID=A0A7S2T5G3_9CHLO|mmetsp:Transcript_7841/g.22443  ORF Transcript_7841/g.22443 Transcript_7841/m.22443 type:complete len:208 (+) Transcript_7841:129-752(+)
MAMMMRKRVALCLLVAALGVATGAVAQDIPDSCKSLDPSTLDTSDPSAFATLLPCTGWDQTCQSNVLAAGASCMQEIQAISKWANSSSVQSDLASETGLSANSTDADVKNTTASVTPDQVKADLDARIPDLKTALGGCCGGGITPTCCAAMTPVISGKCLCQQKPVELLKGVLGQDPSEFIGVAAEVLGKLGCNALDGAQVYPQCEA